MHRRFYRASRLAAVSALAAIVGCNGVDLAAVRDFAVQTSSAQGLFDELAADNALTCIRRTENARQTQSQLRAVPSDLTIARTDPNDACYDAASVSTQWRLRNRIVVAYVSAIAGIAGVGSVPNTTKALAQGLAAINVLPQNDASAFADIARTIASAAIQNRQRTEIGAFAKTNDVALHTAVASLQFVADRYGEQLVNERSTLDQMYRDTLRAQTRDATETLPQPVAFERQRLAVRRLRMAWERERARIDERQAAAVAYKDALGLIAASNESIVVRANRFSAGDLAAVLAGFAGSFGDDLSTLAQSAKE